MFFIPIISKTIKILRSQGTPNQVAIGFVLGMMMAFIPLWTLQHLLILLVLIIFNINFGAFLLSLTIFKGVALLIDPLLHSLGYWLLVGTSGLFPFWVWMYNLPVLPFTFFNNTVTMGGSVVSLLLLLPMFYLMRWVVFNYREKIDPKIEKLKIVKIIKSSKIYSIYSTAKNWRES